MKKIQVGGHKDQTKAVYALVDDEDYEELSQYKWYFHKGKNDNRADYTKRYQHKNNKATIISMHRAIMKPPKGMVVDHINGNGLDNRKKNLRVCTNAENCRNAKKPKNNKSGHTGIFWRKEDKGWQVNICVNYKQKYLGVYKKPEDAIRVRKAAEKQFFGEYAPSKLLTNQNKV